MSGKLTMGSVMIGTMQPKTLGEFYTKVLDQKPDMAEEGWYWWQIGEAGLTVGEHSEMSGETKDPGRIMFVFNTEDVKGEFERMSGLGAEVVKEPYEMGGMWIATLADPDGNYFQLMSPWEDK